MKLYKIKPGTVQAIQYSEETRPEVEDLVGGYFRTIPGFFVVKKPSGRIAVVTPDEFHATYEPLIDLRT